MLPLWAEHGLTPWKKARPPGARQRAPAPGARVGVLSPVNGVVPVFGVFAV